MGINNSAIPRLTQVHLPSIQPTRVRAIIDAFSRLLKKSLAFQAWA
jgi:hypothetical protein